MTALQTPAADAPASEWGRLAVSIPGWRNPRLPWMPYLLSPLGTSNVPDPDHWAWEGWFLRLLGFGCRVWQNREDGLRTVEIGGVRASMYPILGRAMIAAAAALGSWPGGGA